MRPPQATDTGHRAHWPPTAEFPPQRQPAEEVPARWRPAAPLRDGEPAVCGNAAPPLPAGAAANLCTAGRGALDAGGVYVRAAGVYVRLGAAGFGFTLRTGGLYGSGGGASVVVVAAGGVTSSATAGPAPDHRTTAPSQHTASTFVVPRARLVESQRPARAPVLRAMAASPSSTPARDMPAVASCRGAAAQSVLGPRFPMRAAPWAPSSRRSNDLPPRGAIGPSLPIAIVTGLDGTPLAPGFQRAFLSGGNESDDSLTGACAARAQATPASR